MTVHGPVKKQQPDGMSHTGGGGGGNAVAPEIIVEEDDTSAEGKRDDAGQD